MGNADLNSTSIVVHVLKRGLMDSINPADQLQQPLQVDIGSDTHCSLWIPITESDCSYHSWLCCMQVLLGKQQEQYCSSRKPPRLR
jgi:hypothetical protein